MIRPNTTTQQKIVSKSGRELLQDQILLEIANNNPVSILLLSCLAWRDYMLYSEVKKSSPVFLLECEWRQSRLFLWHITFIFINNILQHVFSYCHAHFFVPCNTIYYIINFFFFCDHKLYWFWYLSLPNNILIVVIL